MFAYAGSASFPTYQADMTDRSQFPRAVTAAMASRCPAPTYHDSIYSLISLWGFLVALCV